MKRKRIIMEMLFTVIVIAIALVTMLSIDINQDNEGESVKKEEDVQTLKWYINYSWMDIEEKNEVSQYILEHFGINVEFIIPEGNESAKLQTMIDTNALPDLVTLGWWETENQEMINHGQIYPLNQLADQYRQEFYEYVDEDIVNWYSQSDGNLYGYPNYSYTYAEYQQDGGIPSSQNFLVRKDLYEAIGSPDMSTKEGFMEAIQKVVSEYPEVNGEPLIPIGCDEFTSSGNNSFDLYLQNFLAVPYEKDGVFYDRYTDPEYLEWLEVFRQLGQEGFLSNEIFLDKRSQLEEKIVDGRYFCLFYQNNDIENQQKSIWEENPDRIYIPVEGPKNSNGDDPILPVIGMNGWTLTYISKNCEIPEKAIQLITFLLSEEGQQLVLENGLDYYWMLLKEEKEKIPRYLQEIQEWSLSYSHYLGQYELNFRENLEMTNVQAKLQQIWGETLPQLLLSKNQREFQNILNEYIEQRKENRYQDYVIEATKLIEKNKQQIGLES